MKLHTTFPLALCLVLASVGTGVGAWAQGSAPQTPAKACPAILQHQFSRLQDEAPQNLCQYAGKAILVVNTASYCGFTSQYQGLEALYAKYEKSGLVVLGFPSNDFGKQEPGSSKEIADFCFNTYGVCSSDLEKKEGGTRQVELSQIPDRPQWQGRGQFPQQCRARRSEAGGGGDARAAIGVRPFN
jgi:hypothetical protein